MDGCCTSSYIFRKFVTPPENNSAGIIKSIIHLFKVVKGKSELKNLLLELVIFISVSGIL